MKALTIRPGKLTLAQLRDVYQHPVTLTLDDNAYGPIQQSVACVERIVEENRTTYGINTGFGLLASTRIARDDLENLQRSIVLSHAAGVGEPTDDNLVRLIMVLKINSLSRGFSGIRLEVIQALIALVNAEVYPHIPLKGSVGASGDLAPLAHMSLPLLGLGEVEYKGAVRPAAGVLAELGWQPIELQSKEGLALLNGTQFMSAYGVWALIQSRRLSEWADRIGALSLDAFDGRIEPFCDEVHLIRAHRGQLATARNIRRLLEGSQLAARPKKHVQDPYSFRCIPQVHGASKDTIDYVESVLTTEINSTTDNPTVFPDEDMVVSAGNFHGQPIALAMDFLAIALAELGNISERRTYKLISGARELPKFLVANPGLNSGFMIPQYTAASIVSQSKGLCMPASVDSIPSSQGQEDHVSMGSNAATKLYRVVLNTERVLAIELFNAAQALDFRRPARSSAAIEHMVADYRKRVPFIDNDSVMYPHIESSIQFLRAL